MPGDKPTGIFVGGNKTLQVVRATVTPIKKVYGTFALADTKQLVAVVTKKPTGKNYTSLNNAATIIKATTATPTPEPEHNNNFMMYSLLALLVAGSIFAVIKFVK